MQDNSPNPFGSVESGHEYVCLLLQAVEEARQTIEEDLAEATGGPDPRRADALYIVRYKLIQLDERLRSSSRILKDLRTLHRMLLGEGSVSSA